MAASSGSVSGGTACPSVPGGRYAAELTEAARLITERVRGAGTDFDLVWQSRSGPPSVPWLEPDICDHLQVLAKDRVPAVVVVPVGFVSDHMEVVHDLDTEAREVAESLGLGFARAAAPGSSERFARMVADLVAERSAQLPGAAAQAPREALGSFGPAVSDCPADCCRYTPRRPGSARPDSNS
jgi:ferrochelatase